MYIASASTTTKFHELSSSSSAFHYQPGSKVEGPIRSISWSKDGHWLAIVPHSGQVEIVSLKSNQLKLVHIVQDIGEPSCAGFQFNSKKYLAIGTKHGQVLLYDIKSRSTKKRFPRTSCMITHVGFTGKDSHCVAGCSNGEVQVYNNVSNTIACTLKVPKSNSLSALRTHIMKRNVIAGGSNEGIVVVWDSNISRSKFQVEAHKSPVTGVALSPINSSLLISTGMDRQFSVYDIDIKERIACVPLENTPTAVDFIADDSSYFAIGSQNGKIHMFDSRKLHEPVHSFDAHQSAIKHLLFQRPDESAASNNSSLGSLIGEDIRIVKSNDELGNINKKKRTSDVFGYVAQGPAGSDALDGNKKPHVMATSLEAGDSFIKALGLDTNNTFESFHQETSPREDSMHLNLPERFSAGYSITPNSRVLENISESKGILKQTSTPKLFSQNYLSPITAPNIRNEAAQGSASNVTIADIQTATRDIIQGEIKSALDDVKLEMLNHVTEAKMQLKTLIMDVQFSNFKEFNKITENCNMIRDEISSESGTTHENFLLEENMYLKKKIEMLEAQLAGLTVVNSEVNGN